MSQFYQCQQNSVQQEGQHFDQALRFFARRLKIAEIRWGFGVHQNRATSCSGNVKCPYSRLNRDLLIWKNKNKTLLFKNFITKESNKNIFFCLFAVYLSVLITYSCLSVLLTNSTLILTSGNIIVSHEEPSSGQYWWHLIWFFSIILFNMSTALLFCSQTISQKWPAVCGNGPCVKIYCLSAFSICNF